MRRAVPLPARMRGRAVERVAYALTAVAVVGTAARWFCWKTIDINRSIGCEKFRIEVGGLGYWGRCDYDLTFHRTGPETGWRKVSPYDCVGDPFGDVTDALIGMPQALHVPCTLVRTRVRISCGESVVYEGPVTSECRGEGLCVFAP